MKMKGIKKHRQKLHMTQSELAKKVYVSQESVSQWERGVTQPNAGILPNLAQILKCRIDELY